MVKGRNVAPTALYRSRCDHQLKLRGIVSAERADDAFVHALDHALDHDLDHDLDHARHRALRRMRQREIV